MFPAAIEDVIDSFFNSFRKIPILNKISFLLYDPIKQKYLSKKRQRIEMVSKININKDNTLRNIEKN